MVLLCRAIMQLFANDLCGPRCNRRLHQRGLLRETESACDRGLMPASSLRGLIIVVHHPYAPRAYSGRSEERRARFGGAGEEARAQAVTGEALRVALASQPTQFVLIHPQERPGYFIEFHMSELLMRPTYSERIKRLSAIQR
jgi:hypothetical protein